MASQKVSDSWRTDFCILTVRSVFYMSQDVSPGFTDRLIILSPGAGFIVSSVVKTSSWPFFLAMKRGTRDLCSLP